MITQLQQLESLSIWPIAQIGHRFNNTYQPPLPK